MKTAIWYNADRTGIIDYLEYYQNGEPKSVFMEWYTGDPEVNPEPILSGYMGNRHLEDGGGIYTEEYYDLEGTPVMIGRYVVDYDFENKCEMCFEYWDYYEDGVLVRRENYYHYSYEGGAWCDNWVQYVTYYDADGNVTSIVEYDENGNVVE